MILNNNDIISCSRVLTGGAARVKHWNQVSASYLLNFDGSKPIRAFLTLREWLVTPRRMVPDPWSGGLYCSFRSVRGGCCGKNLFLPFSLNMKTKFHLISWDPGANTDDNRTSSMFHTGHRWRLSRGGGGSSPLHLQYFLLTLSD